MTVQQADIHIYKSAIGDSTGGGASATQVTGTAKNNYFADTSDVERIAGGSRYRKSFVGNDHATDSLLGPKVWINPDGLGLNPTKIGLGFDETDDDTATQGNMTNFTAAAVAELVSTAADTRGVIVIGIDNATSEPASEALTLNGTTPVPTTIVWSKVYAVLLDAEHGTNSVSVKQGTAGTVRGTIGANRVMCFVWVTASAEGSAIWLPDLIAGARWGIWEWQDWTAATSPQRPSDPVLRVKETA